MSTAGFVYFIKPVGMRGPIKIGHSAVPLARLSSLSAWSPFKLEVVATVVGTAKLERNIHECFADDHSHREWFYASDRLLTAIDKIRAGVPVERAIDLTQKRGTIRNYKERLPPDDRLCTAYNVRIGAALRRANNKVERGLVVHEPEAVTEAMRVWRGTWHSSGSIRGPKPSQDQLAIVDRFIADPVAHGLIRSRESLWPTPHTAGAA